MANNVSTCSICTDNIEIGQVIFKNTLAFEGEHSLNAENMSPIQTKCNHVFHESCLAQWISQYKAKTSPPPCPNCRTPLMENGGVIPQAGLSTNNYIQPALNTIGVNHTPILYTNPVTDDDTDPIVIGSFSANGVSFF